MMIMEIDQAGVTDNVEAFRLGGEAKFLALLVIYRGKRGFLSLGPF